MALAGPHNGELLVMLVKAAGVPLLVKVTLDTAVVQPGKLVKMFV